MSLKQKRGTHPGNVTNSQKENSGLEDRLENLPEKFVGLPLPPLSVQCCPSTQQHSTHSQPKWIARSPDEAAGLLTWDCIII